jgi:hypothetical protein
MKFVLCSYLLSIDSQVLDESRALLVVITILIIGQDERVVKKLPNGVNPSVSQASSPQA